jgi:hypothetical protein
MKLYEVQDVTERKTGQMNVYTTIARRYVTFMSIQIHNNRQEHKNTTAHTDKFSVSSNT